MYHNLAVLFISECPLHCFILENLLEMSVCNFFLDCNEDISVNIKYLSILHIILN